MEIEEILSQIKYSPRRFPRKALEEAIQKRDEIIPFLLEILEHSEKHADELVEERNYSAHMYAMYLLAQFREKRAYPLLVKFFSLPYEVLIDLAGDIVTEDLDRIFASVSCGDPIFIKELIENSDVYEYIRAAGIGALFVLFTCGELSREEVVEYYKSLFEGKLERENSVVFYSLVQHSADIYPEELYNHIKEAFKENLIDPFWVNMRYVDKRLHAGKEAVLKKALEKPSILIEDIIKEIPWIAYSVDIEENNDEEDLLGMRVAQDPFSQEEEEASLEIFTGKVEHAYSGDYLSKPHRCPRCRSSVEKYYANFIYTTQIGPRFSFVTGYFCVTCPAVIIDEEMIQAGIKEGFNYNGVVGIDYSPEERADLFKTWNGKKTVFRFNETGDIVGFSTAKVSLDKKGKSKKKKKAREARKARKKSTRKKKK